MEKRFYEVTFVKKSKVYVEADSIKEAINTAYDLQPSIENDVLALSPRTETSIDNSEMFLEKDFAELPCDAFILSDGGTMMLDEYKEKNKI